MSEKEVEKPLSPDQFSLLLTGQRGTEGKRRQFHFVFFCGKRVGFTNSCFILLLQLARARIETHSGYLRCPPQDDPNAFRLGIFRLRRRLNACLGEGAGVKWIQTGVGTEYRLVVPPGDIGLDPGFSEVPWNLVPSDLRDLLLEHLPEVNVEEQREITMQSQ